MGQFFNLDPHIHGQLHPNAKGSGDSDSFDPFDCARGRPSGHCLKSRSGSTPACGRQAKQIPDFRLGSRRVAVWGGQSTV